MLDAYEAEYDEQRRDKEKHAHELDQLRNANRSLSTQVYVETLLSGIMILCANKIRKQLEASLAAM